MRLSSPPRTVEAIESLEITCLDRIIRVCWNINMGCIKVDCIKVVSKSCTKFIGESLREQAANLWPEALAK
jgi:hypothetical protein